MRLVGVLGGTFDPVHIGHIRLAVELNERLGFDHTRLIPNGIPNHREKAEASDELRLAMLQAASDIPALKVDDREIRRAGVSYMVDTLSSLRSDFPADAFCLIVGLDAYFGLPKWHRWQEIFELAHVIVATRPNAELHGDDVLENAVANRIVDSAAGLAGVSNGKVLFIDIPQLEISSTDIRRRRREGLNVSYLVPAGTLNIIESHNLYAN